MRATENLYLVQDADVPLYVVAPSYGKAVERWEEQIRSDGSIPPSEVVYPPHGVQLVAQADELLLPSQAMPASSHVDYATVREIAEASDDELPGMEYLEPHEVRDLCREVLRLDAALAAVQNAGGTAS